MDKDILEGIQEAELFRAKWTQGARDEHTSSGGYFAGPDQSFPLKDASDISDAWGLAGHADNPDQVRRNIISWAKKNGHTDALPESAKEFAGMKDGDKKDDKAERSEQSEYHALYMPVTSFSRYDDPEWIVEGQATAEVPDSYGTIFTYEASKKAFQRWYSKYANVREMHGKSAVGKGIKLDFDDASKRVLVRTRVSKTEPNVLKKFQEAIYNGFSVGATNVKMGRMTYQGKTYPAITEYDLAELSYVDAPSTPGSDAYIVARAAEGQEFVLSELIDDSDPETPAEQSPPQESIQAVETAELERVGKAISSTSQKSIHAGVAGALKGAKAMMDLCASSGCDSCAKASKAIDPDNDGDVDWLNIDNPDQAEDDQMERMQRLVEPVLERSLSPVYQRQQSFLARLSQFDNNYTEIQQQLEEIKAFKEVFTEIKATLVQLDEIKATLERSVSSTGMQDEVRAELSAVKDLMQRVADTPMPGGPVLNGASRPQAYDKSIPYGTPQTPVDAEEVRRQTIEEMQRSGVFTTMEQQIAASAMKLRSMPMMPPTRI